MKPKLLPVLEGCIEVGVTVGTRRVHKHNDNPTEDQIQAAIATAIMDEIYERFDFVDEANGS